MPSRPKVLQIQPEKIEENRGFPMVLRGSGFQSGTDVRIGTTTISATFINEEELRFNLPVSLSADTYLVSVVNPDGGISNNLNFEVYSPLSFRDGYVKRIVDPRTLPLPVPHNQRIDSQRIAAGSQFTGTLPDAPQGTWKDGSAPTSGGYWMYNDDIVIRQVDFTADGFEGVARATGSGLYVLRKGGAEQFLLSVGGVPPDGEGQDKDISLRDESIYVDKGEPLIFRTTGATLEMVVSILVEKRNPSGR